MDKEILYKYFNHTSSPTQDEQLLHWLDEDFSHYEELEKEHRLYNALLMADEPVTSTKQDKNKILHLWKQVASYAAVVLLFFGVGYWFANPDIIDEREAFTTIEVPAGQRTNLTLSDGTQITLNSLSKLKYPQSFGGSLREVELTGEGYFKVKHDSEHPFVVNTNHCAVRVLGTEFNVQTQASKHPFSVSLIKGSVLLHDKSEIEKDYLMKPTQRVILKDNKFVTTQIPEYEDFSWRNGVLSFHNESFENLVETFESTYGVKFVNMMHHTPIKNFTGKILIDEGVDHALWVLSRNSNFDYFRDATNHSTIYLKDK